MSVDRDESFYVRALRRMLELGMISNEGFERLAAKGEPDGESRACGAYMALLSVALWPAPLTATQAVEGER